MVSLWTLLALVDPRRKALFQKKPVIIRDEVILVKLDALDAMSSTLSHTKGVRDNQSYFNG